MAYKLLLADDSITIQKVVELTLSEEDFDVAAFGDGESALEAARRIVPDIVLADVFMPKMDGYELCGKLKEDPSLDHVPVILLAGTFENYDEMKAARVKADDHITKPFESTELVSKVKRLVEHKKAMPEFLEVEPIEEAVLAEAATEAAPRETDDLWNVVDMSSKDQPLADATVTLTEDELWKRANLVSDTDTPVQAAAEEAVPWEVLSGEPVLEDDEITAEELLEPELYAEPILEAEPYEEEILDAEPMVEEAEEALEAEPVSETAEEASITEPKTEPAPVEEELVPAAVYDLEELAAEPAPESVAAESALSMPFESAPPLDETPVYSPPAQGPVPAPAEPIPIEVIREEIRKAVREALSEMGKDAVEQVVWEVLPDIAEELIQKEIENLKR